MFAAAEDKRTAAAGLAETLSAAHALLPEHIADKERVAFPIIDRYVGLDD
ncbi:hypothetical protein ACQP0C_10420 [Nocardia sp. CA-129566]